MNAPGDVQVSTHRPKHVNRSNTIGWLTPAARPYAILMRGVINGYKEGRLCASDAPYSTLYAMLNRLVTQKEITWIGSGMNLYSDNRCEEPEDLEDLRKLPEV